MFNRFMKDARGVAAAGAEHARALGASAVEAEHLLLALADLRTGVPAQVLGPAGLEPAALRDALEAELVRSLRAVGVTLDPPPPGRPSAAAPRFGASAKAALERSLEVAVARGDHRIGTGHVLLGVLGAREGTLPRALAGLGVAPADLAARASAALDAERRSAAA